MTVKQLDTKFSLEYFIPYRMNRASEAISLAFAAQYKATYDMTRPEWRALALLGFHGRLTASEISVLSTMHKTKVSRAIFSMEKKRWLRRDQDLQDRRVEHLALTPTGRKRYEDISAMAQSFEAELLERLGSRGLKHLKAALEIVESRILNAKARRRPRTG